MDPNELVAVGWEWTEEETVLARSGPGVPRGGQESQPRPGLALFKADQGFLGKKGDHPEERREHESHQGGNRQGMEGWSVANA